MICVCCGDSDAQLAKEFALAVFFAQLENIFGIVMGWVKKSVNIYRTACNQNDFMSAGWRICNFERCKKAIVMLRL